MRTITEIEREVIHKLIEWHSDGQSIKLGDVLLKLYPIEYITPSDKDGVFYRNALKISYDEKNTSLSIILEAINIIDLLVKKDYLVVKDFFEDKIIGAENVDLEFRHIRDNTHYVDTTLMNYYDYDLWKLLNSHYYVTNSLIDFAKDFKTPEQRRHKCTTIISVFAIILSIAIGIASPFISKCISDKSNKDNLERVITAIKEYNTVNIDSIKHFPTDTFNVKVVQPIVNSVNKSKIKSITESCTDSLNQQR